MPEPDMITRANEIRGLAFLLVKFFNAGADQRMQKLDPSLNSLQFGVLQMLQSETLTVSVISQRLGMDPSSIVRLIDSLERLGLAARGVDPHDRRRNPLHITEKGRDLLAAVPTLTEADPAVKALQSLGGERSLQLRDLLIKVLLRIPEGRAILESVPRPPDYVADAEDESRPEETPRRMDEGERK